MEQSEILEGNKLIAEFMGEKRIHNGYDIHKYGRLKYSPMAGINDAPDHTTKYSDDELLYHSNWNWLIDVIEKIGKNYHVRITWTVGAIEVTYIDRPDIDDDNSIADFGGFGSITNTWKCVVKFIKWYNVKFKIKS